ncbi:MAG: DUF4186 family protein [Candidatus Nanohaloarchaea archaeon]
MRKLRLPGRDVQKPKLSEKDYRLIEDLGISELKSQAEEIVESRIEEDRDVPAAGNPIYKAMHACRAISREELSRSHRIPDTGELPDRHRKALVNLLMRWIIREYNFLEKEKEEQSQLWGY